MYSFIFGLYYAKMIASTKLFVWMALYRAAWFVVYVSMLSVLQDLVF